MTPADSLRGYADPIVWLVLCAFFIARGVLKTGLGRRIAFLFIRTLGKRSLGLAYSLVATDALLATIVPSNSARAGGIVFPVARSLAEAYDSTPGPTARRLGAYLMATVYQCDVIACAMFLTGQASNVLIAKFALDAVGYEITYAKWMLGSIVPGIAALLLVPLLIYRMYPPEVKHTPHATEFAQEELKKLGPMSRDERMMQLVFALVAGLWITQAWHSIHYAVVSTSSASRSSVVRKAPCSAATRPGAPSACSRHLRPRTPVRPSGARWAPSTAVTRSSALICRSAITSGRSSPLPT
jgi:DASS family divalent anion:Na+ symporter